MSIFSRAFTGLTNVLSSGVRMAASPRLLGRYSGGAGAAQEIQLGAGFSFVGDTLTYTSGGGAATWGAITGTLASQSDLVAALALKAPLISPSFTTPSLGVATVTTINDLTLNTGGGVIANSPTELLISWDGFGTSEGAVLIKGYVRTSLGGSIDTEGTGTINLGSNGTRTVLTGSATTNRAVAIPNVSGTAGVLRSFADSTAANAVVSIGDAWWDTTLNKARVRLT